MICDHPCLLSLTDYADYADPFNARHAEQVQRATSTILTEMCVSTGVGSFDHLTPDNLNKRTVTKDKLCQWLGAFVHIMDRFANPHLQMAVKCLEQISTELLAEEKN